MLTRQPPILRRRAARVCGSCPSSVEGGTCHAAAFGGGEVFRSRAFFCSRPSHRTLRARAAVARESARELHGGHRRHETRDGGPTGYTSYARNAKIRSHGHACTERGTTATTLWLASKLCCVERCGRARASGEGAARASGQREQSRGLMRTAMWPINTGDLRSFA